MYAGKKGPRTEEFMKTKARYLAMSTLPLLMAQPTVPQSKQRFSWYTYRALRGSLGRTKESNSPPSCSRHIPLCNGCKPVDSPEAQTGRASEATEARDACRLVLNGVTARRQTCCTIMR